MAGDWIKIREDLHEDPAVLKLSAKLRTRPEHVVGYCVRFWSWVSRNCDDGYIRGVDIDAVESVLNLPNFLHYLCEVEWLDYIEETHGCTMIIPHFERHLSESAKKRARDTERKREGRKASEKRPSSVRKKTDKTRTREEKTREETFSRRRLQDLEFVGSVAAPAAKRILLTRRAGIPRELAWQAACLLTAIDEDEVNTLCAKLTSGTVESPGRYIGGVCKHFCRERGLDWAEVKQAMPPCPQPKEEVVGG